MQEIQLPGVARTGMEPWTLFGASMALTAHARFATGDDVAHGEALFRASRSGSLQILTAENPHLDYPALGVVLFALGTWGLRHEQAPPENAVRLLALAERLRFDDDAVCNA